MGTPHSSGMGKGTKVPTQLLPSSPGLHEKPPISHMMTLLSRNASPCLGDCWKLFQVPAPQGEGDRTSGHCLCFSQTQFPQHVGSDPSPSSSVFLLHKASQAGTGPLLDLIISCPFFFLPDGRAHDEQQPRHPRKSPYLFTFATWDPSRETLLPLTNSPRAIFFPPHKTQRG